MEVILAVILTAIVLIVSVKNLRGFKLNTKSMTIIGTMAAVTLVLNLIKLVPFPQGGGFSLLSVLPIMILSIVFGMREGIICAIIVASLQAILKPPLFPLQLPLDYFGSMIAIALTPMLGIESKRNITLGAILAGLLSVSFSILSGVIFFGEFAPEGMNVWKYSILYNFLGYGIEVLLSIIVLNILPLSIIKQKIKS